MSATDSELLTAVMDRDAPRLRSLILENSFVLISISDGTDDEEGVGTLRAEVGEFEALVAFTSEERASVFVGEMDELFEDEEDVDGIIIEGDALLDYIPEGLGLLLDPENEESGVIDPSLAAEVVGAS